MNLVVKLLHKMKRLGRWKGYHISVKDLRKGFDKNNYKKIKNVIKELINNRLVIVEKKEPDLRISLNNDRRIEIERIIREE